MGIESTDCVFPQPQAVSKTGFQSYNEVCFMHFFRHFQWSNNLDLALNNRFGYSLWLGCFEWWGKMAAL